MESTTKGHPMQPPTSKLTPARIVALALIGLAVLGLAWLRFGPGDDRVSVPKGAHAGQLTLHECKYQTEDGSYDADCGTLVVPENRADPDSRLIAVPVTRIHAESTRPGEPVFRLEGGPGKTNMTFPWASRLAAERDVVLLGYRGVDGSSVLDCPEVESALKRSDGFLRGQSLRAEADAFRACADRLTDEGVDLGGYSLVQRADDIEAARVALGYDRINLVSESVGTRTALIYGWRYPKNVHRSVMIGVNPPGHFIWDGKVTDRLIGRYSELCAKDDDCSKRTDDLAASMKRTAADIPDSWAFLPIDEGNVRLASFYGSMESTQENAPLSSPMTLDSWLAAADGDASGMWLQSVLADVFFPGSFVWGEYAAAVTSDARAAKAYFAAGKHERDSILGDAGTRFNWADGRLADTWPATPDAHEYNRVRPSNVETLLVGGELDTATPTEVATKELLPSLANGDQVVLPSFAHSFDFWTYQPEASTRLLNTFYGSGEVDDSRYEPQHVDFTPEVTLPALAKGIAGSMVGLAVLTVLSMLWLPWRVHRRGRFGRKAAVTLRSMYAVMLGLGGWFAGVLIVLTTMPTVPIDHELLTTVSIGVPVGLTVYWAWVHREWPAETKLVGLVAAAAGALAGAWLGFHATVDLLALVTAIVGAIAGANLALILFAISRAGAIEASTVDEARPDATPSAPTVAASR
jgi:pimeloyl-ACP methyl ester carboxylesterase